MDYDDLHTETWNTTDYTDIGSWCYKFMTAPFHEFRSYYNLVDDCFYVHITMPKDKWREYWKKELIAPTTMVVKYQKWVEHYSNPANWQLPDRERVLECHKRSLKECQERLDYVQGKIKELKE